MRPTVRALMCIVLSAVSAGCDPAPVPVDAAAIPDVGAVDGGSDAPFVRPDAGPTGAAIEPLDACDDLVDSLYLTPAGLPAFDPSVRGALLGCASIETISAAELETRLAGVPGIEHTGGDVRVYVIAYRTEREPRGVGGISTALVYLPDVARSERVPTVLVAHGTVGVADVCAPSRVVREGLDVVDLPASYIDALLLSFAAAGLPVVAPDYAGLGTEGTHGYGNWLDPTRSAVDGVAALRALVPSDRLDGGTLVYGHSQGGGIALAVAALEAEDPSLDVRAIVSAAPGYDVASATAIVGFSTFALTPVLRATAGLYLYADYANLTADETRWGDPFADDVAGAFVSAFGTQCYVDAITSLDTPGAGYTPPATVGDALDPAWTAEVADCMGGGACTGLVGEWVARDVANQPDIPADAPPILVVGSEADEINGPGALGCVVDRLRTDAAPYEVCMVDAGDHLAMVSATMGLSIDWAIATATGQAPPGCPGSTVRPRCSLF